MNKQLIAEILEYLRNNSSIEKLTLEEIRNNHHQRESYLLELIEDLLEDEVDENGSMTIWWLYGRDKNIYNSSKEVIRDLSTAEDFVNYMIEGHVQD